MWIAFEALRWLGLAGTLLPVGHGGNAMPDPNVSHHGGGGSWRPAIDVVCFIVVADARGGRSSGCASSWMKVSLGLRPLPVTTVPWCIVLLLEALRVLL